MTITIHSIDSSRAGVERFSAGIGKPLQISRLHFSRNGKLTLILFWFEGETCVLFPSDNARFTINGTEELAGLHELEAW